MTAKLKGVAVTFSMKYFQINLLWGLLLALSINPVIGQDDISDLYNSGLFDQVIDRTSEMIASGDSSYNALYLKILSEVQLGWTEQAIRTLRIATGYYPEDVTFNRLLAGQLYDAGDYPGARQIYSDHVRKDSQDLAALLKLAEIASFQQKYREAIPILEHVLVLDRSNLTGLIMLGDILNRQNDSIAIDYYKRAWDIYPDNQKVAYSLGNLYIQSRMPDQAIPICERILEVDSTNIRFQKLLGFAYYKSGYPGPSITHFKKAVALGDSSAFTFKFLGISQYLSADFEEAIASLQTGTEKDSMDAEIHFFLGASMATTTRKTEAMEHLDQSLELMKPDPQVVSRIYSEQGNIKRLDMKYEMAYLLYKKAWEADSTNLMSLYYMASIKDNSLHQTREALVDYHYFINQLDLLPESNRSSQQYPSIRSIVEDRIVSLEEELFFLDEK